MRIFNAWLSACALGLTAQAAPPQPLTFTPSAQVALTGGTTASTISLKPTAALAGATLNVTGLSLAIDGVQVPATRQSDGSWLAARGKATAGGKLEVFVSHDGIREVLNGTLPPPAGNAAETGSMLRDHKQMAWWILNIGIVLIAAIAISRRMG